MSNGPVVPVQFRLGENLIAVAGTEQEKDWASIVADGDVGNPNTEVTKIDRAQGKVRVLDGNSPGFAAFWVTAPVWATLALPPTLSTLSVAYQKGGGDAAYNESGSAAGTGAYSIGVSVGGSAQASSYCVPKLIKTIVDNSRDNFEFRADWFYLKVTDKASILAALTAKIGSSVSALPNFKVESINVVTTGERGAASFHGQFQASLSSNSGGSSSGSTSGTSEGIDASITIDEYEFPPTLHGSFTLSGSDSTTHTASVSLTIGTIGGSVSGSRSTTSGGSLAPTSVPATSPTDIPHSGWYMYRCEVRPNPEVGNWLIHTLSFDASTI